MLGRTPHPSPSTPPRYDCIIIPGGGLDGSRAPAAWVRARLDAALAHDEAADYYLVLSRGTTHKPPPLDEDGFPVDEAAASAAPSAAASEAARAEDADQYDGNVSGHVYSISADGKVAYINFPANENVELFNCMCEWLKTHKSLGNKKEHISAFTMIKGKKFGQNLIAYRSP